VDVVQPHACGDNSNGWERISGWIGSPPRVWEQRKMEDEGRKMKTTILPVSPSHC
jgi:hypothetical protein